MLKNTLARFALAASLLTVPACADRGTPQIVAVPAIVPSASEEQLAGLVTRDSMVGTGFPKRPDEATK